MVFWSIRYSIFFKPDNIDFFVEWMRKGLKIGGLVYIFTVSPFYRGHDEIMSGYEERIKEGVRFPGWCPSCEKMDVRKVYNSLVCPKKPSTYGNEHSKKAFSRTWFSSYGRVGSCDHQREKSGIALWKRYGWNHCKETIIVIRFPN